MGVYLGPCDSALCYITHYISHSISIIFWTLWTAIVKTAFTQLTSMQEDIGTLVGNACLGKQRVLDGLSKEI